METNEFFKNKKYCEGPLGFPMSDKAAKAAEPLIKQAEKNGYEYKRVFVNLDLPEILDKNERADISVVTDTSIDKSGEVVLASGLDVTAYEKNRVVMFSHDYTQPPVGRAVWLKALPNKQKAQQIKAKTEYAPEGSSPLADQVWNLVKAGFMPGKSIGFQVLDARPPTVKEIEDRPELASAKVVYSKSLLLEYSVVGIPCNNNALAQQVAKGLFVDNYLREHLGLTPEEFLMLPEGKSIFDWSTQLPEPKHCISYKELEQRLINRLK